MKKIFVNVALGFALALNICVLTFFSNEINALYLTGVPEAYPGYMRMWSLFVALACISIILCVTALIFFNIKKKQ